MHNYVDNDDILPSCFINMCTKLSSTTHVCNYKPIELGYEAMVYRLDDIDLQISAYRGIYKGHWGVHQKFIECHVA